MLNAIRQTTEMGCYGIKSVLNETANREFRGALRAQYDEYAQIYEEADRLIRERGGRIKDLNPMAKYLSLIHI